MRWKAVLLGALAAISAAASAQSLPRAELPIREVDYGGDRRYTVTISIAGRPVEAGLDTGSTGLRVLPRALPQDLRKGEHVHYGYSSGIGFDGHIVSVPLALGAVAGEAKIMGIEKVACDRPEAQCGRFNLDMASYGIQGDGVAGQGFAAILGVGFKPDAVANPLVELGVRRWIIDLPLPGQPASGRLVLNPTDAEVGGYAPLKLKGDGNQMDGCLIATSANGKLCAATVFDSGAPGIRLMGLRGTPWPQGTPAEVVLSDGRNEAKMSLVIGRREQASGMFMQPGSERGEPRISLGLAPYFHWSVLYDAEHHEIGLKPR